MKSEIKKQKKLNKNNKKKLQNPKKLFLRQKQEATRKHCKKMLDRKNPTKLLLEPLFQALDPISLILNQNSVSDKPFPLRLTSIDSFIMERGPRYKAYAELREKRLLMKQQNEGLEQKIEATPPPPQARKQVKFQSGLENRGRKGSSSLVLAQSVPDFSSVLRKENRKPVNTLPSVMEMTPPSKSFNKGNSSSNNNNGVFSGSRGSKSTSAGEKKKGGGGFLMARKSYASIDELRGLSFATASGINGEGRGGGRALRKSLSFRAL